MKSDDVTALIRVSIPKQFWLDAIKDFVERARAANLVIRDHTDLTPRRAARVEGHLRFQSLEQGFEAAGLKHAAENLLKQVLPGTDSVIYQPFQRFGSAIVGFAMHTESGTLPARNKSRVGAVQLNFDFMDHLDLPTPAEPQNILFVLVLVARARDTAGALHSIEIAVIDSSYDHFLYCENIQKFLDGYGASTPALSPTSPKPTLPDGAPLVKLRKAPKPMSRPAPPVPDSDASKNDKKGR